MKSKILSSVLAVSLLSGCSVPEVFQAEKSVSNTIQSSMTAGELVSQLRKASAELDNDLSSILYEWVEVNSNVSALLCVSDWGTVIPVLKSENSNKEWLRTNIYGEEDIYGASFFDYRTPPDTSAIRIVYGHNNKNDKDFNKLADLLYSGSESELPLISIYEEQGLLEYKIFSIFTLDSTKKALDINPLWSLSDIENFKVYAYTHSNVETSLPESSDILVVSTCWYGESGVERGLRVLICAAREN